MNTNASVLINDLFASSSSILTPPCKPKTVHLLYVPVSPDPMVSRQCASVLSDIELRRADRFTSESDKALFKQRRAFRRFCAAAVYGSSRPLSQIVFEETENGQPYLADLPNISFSFSSSSLAFIGAWSSTHAIGVDIEDQTRSIETTELARCYFSAAEARAVEELKGQERQQTFFHLWCLKEAALKSIGQGLPFGPENFEFELAPTPHLVQTPSGYGGPEHYNAYIMDRMNSCIALISRRLA